LQLTTAAKAAEIYAKLREQMVSREVEAAGISHALVLKSMRTTPRHMFVPAGSRQQAYFDAALPIGEQQTI